MDSAGNLYGTTEAGGLGAYDFGTVFKISVDGTESILFSFSGADGGEPEAGLIMDSAGNLYGTTSSGGTATVLTSGEVFKISPADAETVLHFFTGGITPAITDGGYPRAGLITIAPETCMGRPPSAARTTRARFSRSALPAH
jgi:uncharacterized repeat protein (TIGR03803 family)